MGKRKIFDEDEETKTLEEYMEESDKMLVIENTSISGVRLPPENEISIGMFLVPGENAISEELWKKVSKNPAIKIYVERQILINKGEGKARPILETLDSFHFQEAKNVVAKERDKKQLERWIRGTEDLQKRNICEAALNNMA
jgi:hypothetical protein